MSVVVWGPSNKWCVDLSQDCLNYLGQYERANWADTPCMHKSSVRMECKDPVLIASSCAICGLLPDGLSGLFTEQSSFDLGMVYLALHWGAVMLEMIVLFLNSSFAHNIIVECLLNILDGFRLSIRNILGKLDALFVLEEFGHLASKHKYYESALPVCTLGVIDSHGLT